MNLRLSHIAIAVPDVLQAAERLRSAFGMQLTQLVENTAQSVRIIYAHLDGGGRLELLEPLGPESPIARFLEKHPCGGLHHISFATSDLDDTLAGLVSHGVKTFHQGIGLNVHGERISFIHPSAFLGVLIELEEQHHAD